MNKIKPISLSEFCNRIKINDSDHQIDFLEHFKEYINIAPYYAIGPYFWFIPDNSKMKIVEVSGNISSLTPYSSEYWLNQGPNFFAELIHEEDRNYVLASIQLAIETAQQLTASERELIRINIYGRLLNKENEFRWTLIQIPAFCVCNEKRIISGFLMITDMSHLNFGSCPMMTIIHFGKTEKMYFKVNKFQVEMVDNNVPYITKREFEIIQLMAKGLNSPDISTKLFLSYHTVENHKRNLRKKTNTKTSAELIDYVWRNNLL